MDKQLLHRLDEVIKTDATIVRKSDFFATHLPFKKLSYLNSGLPINTVKSMDEDDFFSEFMIDNNLNHSFIVVQGESGSGKSHFIRWLKYKYENSINTDHEVCILIERSHNTLQGAIKQIINDSSFNELLSKNELDKLLSANSNLKGERLNYDIIFSFSTEILIDEDEECILSSRERKKLSEFLANQIVQDKLLFKDSGPIERIKRKLSSNTNESQEEIDIRFSAEDFSFSFNSSLMKELEKSGSSRMVMRCAEDFINDEEFMHNSIIYLNSKLDAVIQNSIKISAQDFRDIFLNMRKKLKEKDKNLTLFIEDITAFAGIDKALVESLIVEHESNTSLCRLFSVVGITTGYYNDHFPDNLKGRVTGRIVIDDKAIVQDENDLLELGSKYLNAVYLDSEVFDSWHNNGAIDSDLPISNRFNSHKWSLYKDSNGRVFSVFPFTPNALINLYNTLEQKTPRIFLKEVIKKVFLDYLKSPNTFPPSENEFYGYFKVPKWINPQHEQILNRYVSKSDVYRLSCLFRVWGDGTIYKKINNNEVLVGNLPKEVFEFFNLPIIEGILNNGEQTSNSDKDASKSGIVKPIPPTTTNSSGSDEIKRENDKIIDEFEKRLEELDNWYKSRGEIKRHVDLRDDLCKLLKDAIDWDMKDVSPILVNAAFTRNKVFINGQQSSVDNGLIIDRVYDDYLLLQALIAWRVLGNKSWNFKNSLGYLTNITNWIIRNEYRILKFVKSGGEIEEKNWELFQWALINDYYIQILCGNISKKLTNIEIYLSLFKKELVINREKVLNLGMFSTNVNKKEKEIIDNHEFMIRFFNCKLGKAPIETTSTFYIDAYSVLKEIVKLDKINWDVNLMDIPKVKSYLTKWYISYDLVNSLWINKVNMLIGDNLKETSQNINLITDYTQTGDEQEISDLFVAIKTFLTKTMHNANESYSSDFDEIINGNLNAKQLHEFINNFYSIEKKDFIYKLIYISSNDLNKIIRYAKILIDFNKYLDSKLNKYKELNKDINGIMESKNKLEEEITDNINIVSSTITAIKGGGNSAS